MQLPCLTFWDHKMKSAHALQGILEKKLKIVSLPHMNLSNKLRNNSLPINMSEYLPYFIVKIKIKCLPVPHGLALPFLTQKLCFSLLA